MSFPTFRLILRNIFVITLTLSASSARADSSSAPLNPAACAPTGTYSDTFRITGQIHNKKTFSVDKLQIYPSSKVNVWYYTGKGPVQTSFIGVPLFDLIEEAEVKLDPARKNDILRKYVLISGTDCYESVVAMAELLPNFAGQQVLVAYAKGDGTPVDPQDGMARLVVAGDKAGGRYVSNIRRIEIRSAP